MLGAAATSGDGSLWALILASLLAMLSVSVYKAWQYVLERQRQRYAERMTEKVPPGGEVELGDGPSFVRIRGGLADAGTDEPGSPPEEEGEPVLADANVFPLSARRQDKPGENVWTPPA